MFGELRLDASLTWAGPNGVDAVRALRSSPASILFLRPDLRIVDATDRYLADTMRTRDELVGLGLFEAFPENPDLADGDEGVAALRSSLSRVRATGTADTMPVQRYDIPRPHGGFDQRYWSPVNTPVLDEAGEIVLIHHQVTDVTEVMRAAAQLEDSEADRRRLEEHFTVMERDIVERSLDLHRATAALRANEERFRLVCDATSDALWDWDLASDRLWWSDGIDRLFGYRPAELSPLIDSWTSLIHPDDVDDVLAGIHSAIERGDRDWELEYRFRHRDGHDVWVHDHALIVRDVDGVAYRLVGGMTDVTEHRRVAEQYRRAQRMESIGSVAGGIAHDLNNVLSPVLLGAELLSSDELDPQRRQLLDVIVESARRGASMVQQVLTFARGTDARSDVVDVGDVVEEVVRFLRETFPTNVHIDLETPESRASVRGDATRLHQVLLNLCVNARDAMPTGGTLTLRCEERHVDASYAQMHRGARPGSFVVTTVADTGDGIDPDVLERIWEPFFSTKGPDGGTGLGLPTCETIVRDHGGFIGATSRPGSGSTFEVFLPSVTSDEPAPGEREPPPRGDGRSVLVVDDEESIVGIARAVLEAHGYRVATAASGIEAVAAIATGNDRVDVVLVDLMMPDLDGLATVRALSHLDPDLVFVVVSGSDADDTLRRVSTAEVSAVLAKPYTATQLLESVGDALGLT